MPLNVTVLGAVLVELKVPELVRLPAIANTAFVFSCNDLVLLMATLKRFAVPLRDAVPLKVAVLADAVKLPCTMNEERIVKLEGVVTEAADEITKE